MVLKGSLSSLLYKDIFKDFFIKNSDYNFSLELRNNVESLNVGVFAGILFDKLNR